MGYRLRYGDGGLDLPDGRFTIGRSSKCDLALSDPLVSRRHAVLRIQEGEVVLEDASSNGVFVNDVRVEGERSLEPGDRIGIGRVELVLVAGDHHAERAKRPTSRPSAIVAPEHTDHTRQIAAPLALLSPREREVFALVAHGLTHKEAAEHMGISAKTVDAYRANIVAKLDLKSRAEIVRLALELGVLGPDSDLLGAGA